MKSNILKNFNIILSDKFFLYLILIFNFSLTSCDKALKDVDDAKQKYDDCLNKSFEIYMIVKKKFNPSVVEDKFQRWLNACLTIHKNDLRKIKNDNS